MFLLFLPLRRIKQIEAPCIDWGPKKIFDRKLISLEEPAHIIQPNMYIALKCQKHLHPCKWLVSEPSFWWYAFMPWWFWKKHPKWSQSTIFFRTEQKRLNFGKVVNLFSLISMIGSYYQYDKQDSKGSSPKAPKLLLELLRNI